MINHKTSLAIDDALVSIKRSPSAELSDRFEYSADDVERKNTIEVVSSGNLSDVMNLYEHFLDNPQNISDYNNNQFYGKLRSLILDSNEINVFLKYAEKNNKHPNYSYITRKCSTKLILNSYYEGNNDFEFTLGGFSFNDFLGGLFSSKDRPLNVLVRGDVGDCFASNSDNLNIILEGNCGKLFARYSNNISIMVNGDVDDIFAISSKHISAIIKGKIKGSSFGSYAENLTAFVHDKRRGDYESMGRTVLSGSDVVNHPKYKEIMQNLNARFRE
jgi:formylmethanofuran dehydrogenase subunit C